uniref:CHK kinase-like domain-containing protein n=1 Tax=Glossina palpalis gambiensis TaxID=67801 RepID=A0A1B0B3Q9_9MUSC
MGTGTKDYTPPDWLTVEFLQDVLKEYFKDDTDTLEVHNMKVGAAAVTSSKGSGGEKVHGFASEMHCAILQLKRNHALSKFSVILKVHPKGLTGVLAHKSKLFKREIMTYKEIIPRVEELLTGINDRIKIAPACYYTTEVPEPFLILEDMHRSGYENFEKRRLLNLEYVLLTVRKLAKLHACSAVIARENPRIMEIFEEPPISRHPDRKDFLEFFPVNMRCVAEEISHWPGYEKITEKMFKLSENVIEKAVEMYENQAKRFRVFNIADLWIDNLMFRMNNETQEPDDVMLFDYQLCYYGSPAVDLNYLLYGSVNENVRKVHLKYIVSEYHHILKETLEKLNYNGFIPSLKDITIDMIRNSLQGVIAATCLTPIIFMEKDGYDNLEYLISLNEQGNQIRRENVENPKYRTFLQRTIKEFELSGFLDF